MPIKYYKSVSKSEQSSVIQLIKHEADRVVFVRKEVAEVGGREVARFERYIDSPVQKTFADLLLSSHYQPATEEQFNAFNQIFK